MNFLKTLQKYYSGFIIDQPVGNNAFSFRLKKNKHIYVHPIIQGDLSDLEVSDKVVFSEMSEEGLEINKEGLKNFVYWSYQDKDIFIFDNHNHAFFFWLCAFKFNKFDVPQTLLHVDQHKDMREPDRYFDARDLQNLDLNEVFEYTNYCLNVGNFIKPAQRLGVFDDIIIIDSQDGFKHPLPDRFVLDLDMDIFSDEMSYISEDFKTERIRAYIQKAQFITIATSPYFMDQHKAIELLKKLF